MNAVAAGSDRTSPRWCSGGPPKYSVAATSSRPTGATTAGRDARSAVDLGSAAGYGGVESVVERADRGAGPARTRGDAVLRAGLGVERDGRDAARRSPTLTRSSARCTRSTTSRGRSRRSTSPPTSDRFDVIHDHCGFTALAMADRIDTPLVHTLHGQFTASTAAFYARHGHKAALVGISRAQLESAPAELAARSASIPNPIDVRAWPLREHKDDYLLVDRADDRREGPAPRDRRRPRRWTCRSSWPASSSPASRRSSTARSRHTSTASGSASSARSAARPSARCSPAPARC